MKTLIKITIFSLSILLILSFGSLIYYFVITNDVNLDENKLIKTIQNVEYYNGEDKIIDVGIVNENNVPLSSLKDDTLNAFIYLEDKRFYSHNDGKDITIGN